MNVLLVIDGLGSGGAQRQMVNLAAGLSRRGHHVELFSYYPENHYASAIATTAVQLRVHPKRSRYSAAPIIALHELIRRHPFDVVLSFLDTPNVYNEVCHLLRRRSRVVVSERFMYVPGKMSLTKRILQQLHRVADAITVNSHHQRVRMESTYPWMADKLRTIYNGYDLDEFSMRAAPSETSKSVRLLAIASVFFKKNPLNLAKALHICRNHHHLDVRIDWVGTRTISGEGTRAADETDALLSAYGIVDAWNWLGVRNDVAQLLKSHDALIHPSYFEGLPNVICEALACGTPVLASNVCDHPLLVQDRVTGLLFDPDSPLSIAESIRSFYRLNQAERDAMGRAGRRFAEASLSLDRYLDEYETLFDQLVTRSRGAFR